MFKASAPPMSGLTGADDYANSGAKYQLRGRDIIVPIARRGHGTQSNWNDLGESKPDARRSLEISIAVDKLLDRVR